MLLASPTQHHPALVRRDLAPQISPRTSVPGQLTTQLVLHTSRHQLERKQQQCQHRHPRFSRLSCNASESSKPEAAAVVEYLWLLHARPEREEEDIEVLLDSLWSLQYMIPSIMYAAAGTITDCTVCNKQQPQWTGVQPPASVGSNCTGDRTGDEECEVLQTPGVFTHAVHYRLSSRLALENMLLHPLMSAMQEQVQARCSNSAHIVFEGKVAKRLEALFRRGEEYASGVEHILLLQPGSERGLGADAFLEKLAALAESSVAGGIQASHGAVISCVHTAATHVLMTRFAAAQQMQQLLRTPACAAVMQRDPRVPVVAASSLCISIQPTEESTKVNGGSLNI